MSQDAATLSPHDRVVLAIGRILSAYEFDVSYNMKGARNAIEGNSGQRYLPDVIGRKGLLSVLADIRTRGQRGTQSKTDRGAVQMLQAVLGDFTSQLRRPLGMIVNPNGIQEDAAQIAAHFGITVVTIDMPTVKDILALDPVKDRERILAHARRFGIVFS
ncbi:MAG: hypothetical protein IBX36_03910 [Dehalococcoidia bacterium]|nr:hypothetical protein [Dehalococcoidia bacterium]